MSVLRRLRGRVAGQAGYTHDRAADGAGDPRHDHRGAITTLFVQATNAEFEMNRRFQAQQAARVAIDKMRREIHCASAITPTGVVVLDHGHASRPVPDLGRLAGERHLRHEPGRRGPAVHSCAENNVVLADFSTLQNAFNYAAPVPGTSLGKLTVTLPINTKPSEPNKQWKLVADMVLRNTSR